ncbi:MAG: solute carrier family 23 protein [Devosia sp.]
MADLLAREIDRAGEPLWIADPNANLLFGTAGTEASATADVVVDGFVMGRVGGAHADRVAEVLSVLAAQDGEMRTLARESLDRYKEITMLYSFSEKIIGVRDAADIAAVLCDEATRYLRCEGVAVLFHNVETGRLETAGTAGEPLFQRASREAGDDIVASVVTSGDGEIVNDVHADPRGLIAAPSVHSIACSPLTSNERVLGVVVTATTSPREFTAAELQVLNAMASHAAAAMNVARLDRDLKAQSRRPVNLVYGLDDWPPFGVAMLMGGQHVLIALMSLAYPILVTLEAGGSRIDAAAVVSMSLIAMAIATALQVCRAGPVGSGLLSPYITSAIFLGPSLLAARNGGLAMVASMTILAGAIAIAMSQLLRRFRKIFPAEVSGVVVLTVGLSMVPVALSRLIGVAPGDPTSDWSEWTVGLLTLGTILLATVLSRHLRLYATAIGIGVGYLAAAILGLFGASKLGTVGDLPWVGIQPVSWGEFRIDTALIFPFVAAALASSVKDAGLLITSQKANEANWKRPDTASMSGGVVAGGLGTMVSGALGGLGLGISAGSVGLAVATGVTARVIGLVTAALFLILAFLPKATALLALIPTPVMGAGLLYVACHLVSSGIELIASRMLDARRIYVVGLPLLAGVGLMSAPGLFADASPFVQTLVDSPLATATLLAVMLNLLLNVGVSNKASERFELDGPLRESIARFMERQGGSWGARSDVIGRAVPAATEWCEELRAARMANAVTIDLVFDEFRLTVAISPIIDAAGVVLNGRGDDASHEFAEAATVLARRYGSTVRLTSGGGAEVRFEH